MSPPRKRRLLLVSHNFPPHGSGGVHRPVKFARYLRELGWEVEILTVKNIRYHAYDPSLLAEVEGLPVHRAGSLEPLRWSWLAGWRPPPPPPAVNSFADLEEVAAGGAVRPVSTAGRVYKAVADHLFQPDAQIFWAPFAGARALRLFRQRRFDVVLTTSPPESCHLVGLALKRLTGCRWVADFRDAWTAHHLRRHLWFYHVFLNRLLEKWVLQAADGAVANTEGMARYFKEIGGAASRVLLLRNGYDPADFGEPFPKARAEDFVVVHNGSFRGGRRAGPLLEGWTRAREGDADFASRAKLYLLGINRADDLRRAEALGLREVLFYVGYIPHAEAMRACRGADLLVVAMSAEEGPSLIPGKLYEYLGLARPLLAAVPPGEACGVVAGAARGAVVVPPEDPEAIGAGLRRVFEAWRGGNLKCETEPAFANTYTRRNQVEELSWFLNTFGA